MINRIEGEEITSVVDLTIDNIIPNIIDNNIVTIYDGHHTIFLGHNVTGQMLKIWYKSRGGIFSKDVLNYSLGKEHGKYMLLHKTTEDQIIRLISDEEEFQFRTLKLVDGQLKDRPYMILRNVIKGQELTNTKREYITENEIALEEDEIVPASNTTTQDDDLEQHLGSISLFPE